MGFVSIDAGKSHSRLLHDPYPLDFPTWQGQSAFTRIDQAVPSLTGGPDEEAGGAHMKKPIDIGYYVLFIALAISILSLWSSAIADQKFNPSTKQFETVAPYNPSANPLGTEAPSSTLKYNPSTNRLETVAPKETLKYNPYTNGWGYSAPNAIPKYNPHQNTWDMAPPNYQLKYNPMTGKWETASPDSKLIYNPINNEWKYVSPGVSP